MLFPGHTNNDMLRLHMELKGPFPKKMLKKVNYLKSMILAIDLVLHVPGLEVDRFFLLNILWLADDRWSSKLVRHTNSLGDGIGSPLL